MATDFYGLPAPRIVRAFRLRPEMTENQFTMLGHMRYLGTPEVQERARTLLLGMRPPIEGEIESLLSWFIKPEGA